jgi:hypothetical protein
VVWAQVATRAPPTARPPARPNLPATGSNFYLACCCRLGRPLRHCPHMTGLGPGCPNRPETSQLGAGRETRLRSIRFFPDKIFCQLCHCDSRRLTAASITPATPATPTTPARPATHTGRAVQSSSTMLRRSGAGSTGPRRGLRPTDRSMPAARSAPTGPHTHRHQLPELGLQPPLHFTLQGCSHRLCSSTCVWLK